MVEKHVEWLHVVAVARCWDGTRGAPVGKIWMQPLSARTLLGFPELLTPLDPLEPPEPLELPEAPELEAPELDSPLLDPPELAVPLLDPLPLPAPEDDPPPASPLGTTSVEPPQ